MLGVRLAHLAAEQTALCELLEQAAELGAIEVEGPADLRRGWPGSMRKLVEHPRLREREGAVVEPFVQQAQSLRVDTVEPTQGGDIGFGWGGLVHGGVV